MPGKGGAVLSRDNFFNNDWVSRQTVPKDDNDLHKYALSVNSDGVVRLTVSGEERAAAIELTPDEARYLAVVLNSTADSAEEIKHGD